LKEAAVTDAAGALRQLLDEALDLLATGGDAAAAERQAKAVSALV
jgi:hypothetical protein